jgi:hypothetical protein
MSDVDVAASAGTKTTAADELRAYCDTPDQLWDWIQRHTGLRIPREPVCPGHQAPFDYLRHVYFEPGKDVVVWAPRGGGKTSLGAVATLLDLLHKPGCRARILGGSMEQAMKMWEHLAPKLAELADGAKERAQRVELKDGGDVAVLTQSQRAVRGVRVQKLRCDEVEMFDPRVWTAAQLTTRSRTVQTSRGPVEVAGAVEAMSTYHEATGMMATLVDKARENNVPVIHWCLLEVLEHCPKDRVCDDCPLWNDCKGKAKDKPKGEGFVKIDDAIRMKRRVSLATWDAEMMCRNPKGERSVFQAFDPAKHVRPEAPLRAGEDELCLGVDFGYANPFVCLWVRRDRDVTHVIDEYVQPQTVTPRHLKEIASRGHGQIAWVGCDPAGSAKSDQTAESNLDLFKKAGHKVRTRGSHIIEGLTMIRDALDPGAGGARLFIHPRCKRLIQAMTAYRNNDKGELPVKDGVHDHLIDALRYFYVNTKGPGPAKASVY